ncbi:MAG: 3'-5' exonuclease domain-containing protein 2 [Verrucomicrobia bacterium]|nr:3'-5' exonuclease domain-containing protein 2 [Verrucomicrobiota bacterium]
MLPEPETPKPDPEKRRILKAEINELPLLAWEGPVNLLETLEEMEHAVKDILQESVLGFDTETRPSFKRGEYYPPALIQLATSESVYLFRISKTKTFAPLVPILESSKIIKCGVGIRDDVRELRKWKDFDADGFFEIGELTAKLGYENRGLRALAALLLNGRISKAAQVSNWARDQLDSKQIKYAATDAWISREIYLRATQESEHRH